MLGGLSSPREPFAVEPTAVNPQVDLTKVDLV